MTSKIGPPPTGPPPLSSAINNNSYSNPYSNIQPITPPKHTHNLNIFKEDTNSISTNNNNAIQYNSPIKESHGLNNIPESPNTAGKFIEKSLEDIDNLISVRRKAILDLRKMNQLKFGTKKDSKISVVNTETNIETSSQQETKQSSTSDIINHLSTTHFPNKDIMISPPGVFPSTNKPLTRAPISSRQTLTNDTLSSSYNVESSNTNTNNNTSTLHYALNSHNNEEYSPTRSLLNGNKSTSTSRNNITNNNEVNNINIIKIEEINQQLQDEKLHHQQCITRLKEIENQLQIQNDRNNALIEENNELINLKDDKEDELDSVNDQLLFLRNQLLVKSGQVSELEIEIINKGDVEIELRNELDILRHQLGQQSNNNQNDGEIIDNSSNHTVEEYNSLINRLIELENKNKDLNETCQTYKLYYDDIVNENTLWGNKYDDQLLEIEELTQEIIILKKNNDIKSKQTKEKGTIDEELENADITRLATSTDDGINNSMIDDEEEEEQKEEDLDKKLYTLAEVWKLLGDRDEECKRENKRNLDECNLKINQANITIIKFEELIQQKQEENEDLTQNYDELNENYLDIQKYCSKLRDSAKFWMQLSVNRLKIMKKRRIFDSIRLFSMMTIVLSKKRNSSKDKDKINRIDNLIDLQNDGDYDNENSQQENNVKDTYTNSRPSKLDIPIDDQYNDNTNEFRLRKRNVNSNESNDKTVYRDGPPVVETLQLSKRLTPRQGIDGSNLVTPRDDYADIQTPRQSHTSFLMVLASIQVFIWFIILLVAYVYFEEFIIVHLPQAPQLSKFF